MNRLDRMYLVFMLESGRYYTTALKRLGLLK